MYTVSELIEALKQCPQGAIVFACGFGDYLEQEVCTVAIDPKENAVTLFTE